MTISRRKNKPVAKTEDRPTAAAESGVQYHCDVCGLDISSTVRISCATCATLPGVADTYDLCCCCFLEGAESASHKPWHDYRVVEQHAYPIFCEDWGADEELLLIDGAQIYGLGNWADIADHIGNRTKEEVQKHYIETYVEGKDGTEDGELRARKAVEDAPKGINGIQRLPVVGPNVHFQTIVDAEEFQSRKRQRIEKLRDSQAAFGGSSSQQPLGPSGKPVPPKPLVSAPTSHSELAGFMPGRLEFEHEYEQDAENYIKDMDFGKVYRYGGDEILSELDALGRQAERGHMRMEASGRGGPGLGSRGQKGAADEEGHEDASGALEQKEDDEDGDGKEDEENEGVAEGEEEEPEEADETLDADQTADGEGDQTTGTGGAANVSASQSVDTDDRAPDWDEDEGDLELKLMILDIYNERLDRRTKRKEFIFSRNLIDYKRTVGAERKRPKEERELLNRVRHFSQMQTGEDFEEFYNGLCYEDALRRSAAQLQMYRRAGITTLADAARFDEEQAERARRAAVAAEGGLSAYPAVGSHRTAASRTAARDTQTPERADSTTPAAPKKKANVDEKKPARKPPKPLDISSNPSLRLLTRPEQELCSVVRIQPQVFLVMKKEILIEYQRRKGKFSRRESRQLFKCDVNKVGKVYDLLESEGYLRAALQIHGDWDYTGAPPGWNQKGNTAEVSIKGDSDEMNGLRTPLSLANGVNGAVSSPREDVKAGASIPRSASTATISNGLHSDKQERQPGLAERPTVAI